MTAPASYKEVIKRYGECPDTISAYFNNFQKLVEDFQYEVAVAYCFLKLEQAYNRTLYGGSRKMRKVHPDIARSVLDKQHLTREGFLELYKNIYDKALPCQVVEQIKSAEKIRDRIIHGKKVEHKDARKCLVDILDFSTELEAEVRNIACFSPFGDMRGLTGRSQSLDKSTSRWVMKGLGFAIK